MAGPRVFAVPEFLADIPQGSATANLQDAQRLQNGFMRGTLGCKQAASAAPTAHQRLALHIAELPSFSKAAMRLPVVPERLTVVVPLWRLGGAAVLATGILLPATAAKTMSQPSQTVSRTLQGVASAPAVAIDAHGAVFVAWSQTSGVYPAVVVARLRNDRLELVGPDADGGGASDTRGEATVPALALDRAGNPIIAWQDRSSGNPEIYARAWTGAAWEPHDVFSSGGGISDTPTRMSAQPALALDAHDEATVAWAESFGSRADVFVRRLQRLPTSRRAKDIGEHAGIVGFPAKSSSASQAALAIDAQGRITVAWIDNASGQDEVYLQRWDGERWQGLGDSGLDGRVRLSHGPAASVALRLDGDGNPVLAWREVDETRARVRVMRWSGGAWQPFVPGIDMPRDVLAWPCLALDLHGQPVLAFRLGATVEMRHWTGRGWDPVATFAWEAAPAQMAASKRLLALDARDDKACVTWIDGGDAPAIHLACRTIVPR